MLTREQFEALLARLRGEGEALTAAELRSVAEYVSAHGGTPADGDTAPTAGDADQLADDEIGEVTELVRALGLADDTPTDVIEAAVEVVEATAIADQARSEVDAAEEARRSDLRQRLEGTPAEGDADAGDGTGDGGEADADADGGDGTGDGEGAGDGAGEGGDGEGAGDGAGEGAGEGEPVGAGATASGTRAPARRPIPGQMRHRRPSGEFRPGANARNHNRIVRDGGGEFENLDAAFEAMIERRAGFLSAHGVVNERIPMARIEAEYPQERVLDAQRDPWGSAERMRAVTAALRDATAGELDALTASGGLCAPLQPYYGIARLAEADRPVRASFTQFNAGRGGLIFREPPDFPDFATAVEIWTEANDANPGSNGPSTKPCLVVPCPDQSEAVIYAVTECLEMGNFMARTDPETIQNARENTMAAFARKAEVKLLDLTKAASTAVTAGDALGAYRDLVYQWGVAAVGFRSRHRMREDAVLEVRAPWWVRQMIILDLVRNLPGDGNMVVANNVLERALAMFNIRIAGLYMDSPTSGTSQVFPTQIGSQLLDFPADVQWHLTHPGAFLLLDNGRLDLGIFRDSGLIETNDFRTFAETFEGLAFLGLESMWVTSTVCPNGAVSGTVDPSSFCSGIYVPA